MSQTGARRLHWKLTAFKLKWATLCNSALWPALDPVLRSMTSPGSKSSGILGGAGMLGGVAKPTLTGSSPWRRKAVLL